jgi:hypothetical protein
VGHFGFGDGKLWSTAMTLLEQPNTTTTRVHIHIPRPAAPRALRPPALSLRCLICHRPFDFAIGEAAVILKHVAYANDFVHEGACLESALEMIFAEPGYDGAAFSHDPRRGRVLRTESAEGWVAVLGGTIEPLVTWAVVQYHDGTLHMEGIARERAWADEPGAAEFASDVRFQAAA